jgi:NAD(P)-dependent dehydrogenase (short-subunit alcohol dehydrogenase family)
MKIADKTFPITGGASGLGEAVVRKVDAFTPITTYPPRFGRLDEFAALVRHLVENEMINGTPIRLDGGIHMPAK